MSLIPSEALDRLNRAASQLRPVARHAGHDIAHEVASLRRDVAMLAEIARRNGAATLEIGGSAAHDLAHLAQRDGAVMLRELERGAEHTADFIRRRPLPALAVLGGVLLVGFLMLRRD